MALGYGNLDIKPIAHVSTRAMSRIFNSMDLALLLPRAHFSTQLDPLKDRIHVQER